LTAQGGRKTDQSRLKESVITPREKKPGARTISFRLDMGRILLYGMQSISVDELEQISD
jgi:hypothetical protein